MKKYDVCIIGGGAAGLAAAASLNNSISICMLEKNEIPGKKIMATGGGRCNITNAAC
ncbi:MAG: FAD-dependent oxidoreductase, partial [Lentihominibacter sp.]